jgi:hypothetical protein
MAVRSLIAWLFLVIAGCATDNFTLLTPNDGWNRLPGPPPGEKAILAMAGDQVNKRYNSPDHPQIVWFGRNEGEYLLYFYNKTPVYPGRQSEHCFDQIVHFKKTDQGWENTDKNWPQMILCGND